MKKILKDSSFQDDTSARIKTSFVFFKRFPISQCMMKVVRNLSDKSTEVEKSQWGRVIGTIGFMFIVLCCDWKFFLGTTEEIFWWLIVIQNNYSSLSTSSYLKKKVVEKLILGPSFQAIKEFAKKLQLMNMTQHPDTHRGTYLESQSVHFLSVIVPDPLLSY